MPGGQFTSKPTCLNASRAFGHVGFLRSDISTTSNNKGHHHGWQDRCGEGPTQGSRRRVERKFLHELKGEASQVSREFEALFEESMDQPQEQNTCG